MPRPLPLPTKKGFSETLINDGFNEFKEAAEEYGMTGSEPDWHEARSFEWRQLSIEQRQLAIRGIRDRIEANARDDPAMKSLPQNYLKRQMWDRRIVEPTKSRAEAIFA
jgi:hypothetical protein